MVYHHNSSVCCTIWDRVITTLTTYIDVCVVMTRSRKGQQSGLCTRKRLFILRLC